MDQLERRDREFEEKLAIASERLATKIAQRAALRADVPSSESTTPSHEEPAPKEKPVLEKRAAEEKSVLGEKTSVEENGMPLEPSPRAPQDEEKQARRETDVEGEGEEFLYFVIL